jgi:hypothetical protein
VQQSKLAAPLRKAHAEFGLKQAAQRAFSRPDRAAEPGERPVVGRIPVQQLGDRAQAVVVRLGK